MSAPGQGRQESRAATMVDVARRADVSLKTVSRVVNGEPSVAPVLAERVRLAVDELGYRRNSVAASLRRGRATGTLAVVTRDVANPFYSSVGAGAMDVADEHGLMVFTASSEGEAPRQARLLDALSAYRPEGYLVTPLQHPDATLRRLVDEGSPVVCVDVPAPGVETDLVRLPNFEYSRRAIDKAVAHGADSFALLYLDRSFETMNERHAGAVAALAEHGIAVPPEREVWGIRTAMDATLRAREILGSPRPPSALFCANNQVALGAAIAIAESGLPTTLVSFDDIALVPLFSFGYVGVRYEPRDLGREAMRLMLARRADPGRPPETRVIDAELVVVNL